MQNPKYPLYLRAALLPALLVSLVAFAPLSARAQVKAAPGDSPDSAATSTRKPGPAEMAGAPGVSGETLELSPFEVTESNTGYYQANTMSGTRLNTRLEDIGSSISVVTKEQMADFAMLDINDIFAYEAGTEGTGNYTDFTVNRKGQAGDSVMDDPQGANRVRGLTAASMSLSGFATSGRVPVDPINIDSVEISRGPNSNIFGLGEGSGTVNLVGASANFTRDFTTTTMRVDDRDGYRTSLDVNRMLIKDKLAVRVSGVYQHDGFVRKPSGYNTRRFNAMVRVQPFRSTSLRVSFQSYRASGTRANALTPRDGVTNWINYGSPTWDPVTNTVTVNGVSTVMPGTTNPAGLSGLNRSTPVLFVADGGIQLWEVGRVPAANNATGPNNTGGPNRLLETVPDPVMDNHPLFANLPGVQSKDIYDYSSINLSAPNYQMDRDELTTVQFEQYFLETEKNTIAFQFGWQHENADRFTNNLLGTTSPVGTSFYLYVDPNERLLDGSPNPYFKHPYISSAEYAASERPYQRDTYRGQLAYILDFTKSEKWTKWIGRHQLLGYYEERETNSYLYRFRDAMISDHPLYAPAGTPKGNQSATNGFPASPNATRGNYHYYVGDSTGYNVDYGPSQIAYGNYPFTWYDAVNKQWVTDNATLGQSGITEGTAGNSGTHNVIRTKGAIIQSFLWKNRLVTAFGVRDDVTSTKFQNSPVLQANGYDFDYAAMDGWKNAWSTRSGRTQTAGAVLKPFLGWKFIEQARSASGWKGTVADVTRGLSFYFNKSNSFLPATPVTDIYLRDLPNPTSNGKDYGFAINLGSKLSARFNHYTTNQINARAEDSANIVTRLLQVDFDGFAATPFSLQQQSLAWISQLHPDYSPEQVSAESSKIVGFTNDQISQYHGGTKADKADVTAKGEEYELNFNPTKYWTLRANLTRTESINRNISQSNFDWLNERLPYWETIVDPRSGLKWLDTGYNGDFVDPASRTPRAYLQSDVIAPLKLARAAEGTARPQLREWRFNLSTSLRLNGLTDHKILRNFTVGGGVRWESRGAIGFYGVPLNGNYEEAIELDAHNPIWDKAHAYFDGFARYNTKLFGGKIRARFQLNVKNIQESHARLQAITAYPNGVPNTFRIIDPRTFILSASFDL